MIMYLSLKDRQIRHKKTEVVQAERIIQMRVGHIPNLYAVQCFTGWIRPCSCILYKYMYSGL